jgi:hypothetical protein
MTRSSVLTPEKPARTINFATILPLFEQRASPQIVTARATEVQLVKRPRGSASGGALLIRPSVAPKPANLKTLSASTFAMPRAEGTMSNLLGNAALTDLGVEDLRLPFGTPRFVNAATLKRMCRAKRSALLLKRVGERWEVCENSATIDLLDASVEFRLGEIQIFS